MSWAYWYVQKLSAGETITFRPRGGSMSGKIESGQLVTVEPVTAETKLKVGDVVLCRVAGSSYLHFIKATRPDGSFQIGNNKGHINGWTPRSKVYGRCVKVEP